MCEEKDCDCNHGKHHRHHHMWHHRHHMKGYASIVKRTENQVIVPEALLEVADIGVGEFLEIRVRKVKKHENLHHED
jgi:hypothetical protein